MDKGLIAPADDESNNKMMLTDKEVAIRLSISVRTVHKLRNTDPDFPKPSRFGRCVRWSVDSIDNYRDKKAQ